MTLPRGVLATLVLTMLAALAVPGTVAGTSPSGAALSPSGPVPGSSSSCGSIEALATESIAPGLERVVADAVGHRLDRWLIREVEVGSDGTVWVAQGRRVIALGEPGAIEPRSDTWRTFPRDLSVTPSGELWAVEDGGSAVAAEAGAWVDRSGDLPTSGHSLGALEDGSVWRIVRMAEGPNQIVERSGLAWQPSAAIGLGGLLGRRDARYEFARTSDGRTWLGVDQGDRPSGLAVLDEDGWRLSGPLGTVVAPRVIGLAAGPDGSLWVLADLNARHARPGDYRLLRHDGDTWTTFGPEQGMPGEDIGGWTDPSPTLPSPIEVGHDGRVWFSIYGVGLYSFDGLDFGRVDVPGLRPGALDVDVGPDGRVWIVGLRGALYTMCDPATDGSPAVEPREVVSSEVVGDPAA